MRPELHHDALFYGSAGDFVDSLLPFVRDGLERDEHVMVVTSPNNLGIIGDALGTDTEYATAHSAEWYSKPAQTIDRYRRVMEHALSSGKPGLRIVGEVDFGTTDIEHAEWKRYESVLNVAFGGQPAWVVCPYNTRNLAPELVESASRSHPSAFHGKEHSKSHHFVEPANMVGPLPLPTGGQLLGELEVGESLQPVREFVTRTSQQAGLSKPSTEDMCLVVNEIATNGMRHGLPPVKLQAWLDDENLVYDVSDFGPGPQNPFAGFIPPKVSEGDGMGLWLSRLLADRLEITSGDEGTSIRASMSTSSG